MPRACTVCLHVHREKIDRALLKGVTSRTNSSRYGPSPSTLSRHKVHLKALLIKGARDAAASAQAKNDAQELAYSMSLVDELRKLKADVLIAQEKARKRGAWGVFLQAVDRRLRILETQAKLDGRLGDLRTQVNIVNLDPATAKRIAETYLVRHALEAHENGTED